MTCLACKCSPQRPCFPPPPGKSIRHAMRKLVDASPNDTSVRHVGTAAGHGFPGSTPAEQKEIYRTAGVQLASSRFCLVPAGDNEVSSRLSPSVHASAHHGAIPSPHR